MSKPLPPFFIFCIIICSGICCNKFEIVKSIYKIKIDHIISEQPLSSLFCQKMLYFDGFLTPPPPLPLPLHLITNVDKDLEGRKVRATHTSSGSVWNIKL